MPEDQQVQSDSGVQVPHHTHDGINSPKIDYNNLENSVDTADFINKDGSIAFTGDQSMGTNQITNVGEPSGAQDAATKNYVDSNRSEVLTLLGGVTVQSTIAETNLWSYVVPAGTLGTSSVIIARTFLGVAGSTSGITCTLRAYYGGASASLAISTLNTTGLVGYVDFYLIANGATDAQILWRDISLDVGGHDTGPSNTRWYDRQYSTGAEDSTAVQTMKLTVQFDNNHANTRCDTSAALIYVIKG